MEHSLLQILDWSREKNIFAVPGSIDSVSSIGTNNPIKPGAQLVTCVNDILEAYGMGLWKCGDRQ